MSQQISFSGMTIEGNRAWFCSAEYGLLQEVDLDTGIVSVLGFFPDANIYASELYSAIVYHKGELYVAPKNGSRVWIYNLTSRAFRCIEIAFPPESNNFIFNALQRGIATSDAVYFFPGRYSNILRIEAETKEVSYIDEWKKYERLLEGDGGRVIFNNVHYNDKIEICFLPSWRGQGVLRANIKNNEFSYLEPDNLNQGDLLDCVCVPDGRYVISRKDSNRVYLKSGEHFEIGSDEERFFLVEEGNIIILIPLVGATIYSLDISKGMVKRLYTLGVNQTDYVNVYPFFEKKKGMVYIYSKNENTLLMVSLNSGEVKKIELKLGTGVAGLIRQHNFAYLQSNALFECMELSVRDYIKML